MVRSRPFAAHRRLSDRHRVILRRKFFLDPAVQKFVLEKQHGVVVADGRLEKALGVMGRRRADHLQAGRVHEIHFRIRRMKRAAVHAAAHGPRSTMGTGAPQR